MPVAAGASGISLINRRVGTEPRHLFWTVSLLWLGVLVWLAGTHAAEVSKDIPLLGAWAALLMVVNLLPITGWRPAQFTVDLPVTLAAALVLAPTQTAIVATIGTFDPREIKGEISLSRDLFNRSHVGLGSFLGAAAIHALNRSPGTSRLILAFAFAALAIHTALNYALVSVAISLEHRQGFVETLRRMRLGTIPDFALTFLAWGVLGAMLAVLYDQVGALALLAFMGPALLGRQILARSQMWVETERAYRSREQTLVRLSEQIDEERTEERRLIAADLHDEVLQPLFKVTLLSHVVKADLASGRLLAMDEDLPELLAAAELASGTLRELIGDLRRSGLGRGGLTATLLNLVRRLNEEAGISIDARIGQVQTSPAKEVAVYQIAKEALTNATQHAKASSMSVELREDGESLILEVQDDGVGFDPYQQAEGHFGIPIMRDRAAGVRGQFFLDSSPGEGCKVVAVIPSDRDDLAAR
jgi:signal transduction histidine kinase